MPKKPLQRYTVTVRYPKDSSSNVPEVDWIEVLACTEDQVLYRAKLRASKRIEAFLTHSHALGGVPNPRPL